MDNNGDIRTGLKITDTRFVAFGIVGVISVFAILILFVGEGGVRHVPITSNEVIRTTVAFREIGGETKVVGITGNTQMNPTLVSRTGSDTIYLLTVIDQDTDPHMFYIDGLNLHTKILRPGENDTITIYPTREGIYDYYDRLAIDMKKGTTAAFITSLGQIKMVKVAGD
jgi:hypothetical protein